MINSKFSKIVVVDEKEQILSQLTALNASEYKAVMTMIRKGMKKDDKMAIDAAIELHCFNQMP
jgi:hypothetical protein